MWRGCPLLTSRPTRCDWRGWPGTTTRSSSNSSSLPRPGAAELDEVIHSPKPLTSFHTDHPHPRRFRRGHDRTRVRHQPGHASRENKGKVTHPVMAGFCRPVRRAHSQGRQILGFGVIRPRGCRHLGLSPTPLAWRLARWVMPYGTSPGDQGKCRTS
jgi:hypothetical protein